MPSSVNQIEVMFLIQQNSLVQHLNLFLSVTPLLSTNRNSQILQGEQHRRTGILSYALDIPPSMLSFSPSSHKRPTSSNIIVLPSTHYYSSKSTTTTTTWELLEFSMDDQILPLDLTIYGAIHQQEMRTKKSCAMSLNMIWQGMYDQIQRRSLAQFLVPKVLIMLLLTAHTKFLPQFRSF